MVYSIVGGRSSYGNVGFLIPGTIQLDIGGVALVSEFITLAQHEPGLLLASIGLAFLAVMLVHTVWFKNLTAGNRFWPMYPAAGLLALSGLLIGSSVFDTSVRFELLNYLWIVVLAAAGRGWQSDRAVRLKPTDTVPGLPGAGAASRVAPAPLLSVRHHPFATVIRDRRNGALGRKNSPANWLAASTAANAGLPDPTHIASIAVIAA